MKVAYEVMLVESAARSSSGDSGPMGGYANISDVALQLDVTAGSGTLDVYLQTSFDDGATWQDVGHFPQMTAAGRRVLSTHEPAATAGDVSSATFAGSDKSLAADTVSPIRLGDLIRVAWVIAGSFTFSVDAVARS